MLATLDKAAVSYQIVLTKADQVKPPNWPGAWPRSRRRSPSIRPPFPRCCDLGTRGDGIAELRAAIARLLAERK